MQNKDCAGRVVLVTGASRGIGKAVALELAQRGAHVIALSRTQGALEALDDEIRALGGACTLVPCDIKDYDALDRLGASLFERWGRLDGLVANAGILGTLTPLGHVDPERFEAVMAVNVTANWRLIRSLDLPLRQSAAGRVIMLSSGVAHRAKAVAYWGPYAASKAALEMLGRTYAAETLLTNLKIMLVNPGPLRTKMRAAAMPDEDPADLAPPESIAPQLVAMLLPSWQETGALYDCPSGKVLHFQSPA